MKTHIRTDQFGNMGDLLIDKPFFKAIEVDQDAVDNWLEHANQDGSQVRIYCSQSGSNGNTSFNFQIKSYGCLLYTSDAADE